MNHVEPIKSKIDIYRLYQVLKERSVRDYLFFKFAIHTGIRLTDLLNMTVKQLKSQKKGNIRTSWIVEYESTIKVKIPDDLQQEMKGYIEELRLEDEDLIFRSTRTHQCLSRQQAYRIVHHAAERLDLQHVGLTTLRKTFAYHAFQSGISISIIQKYLGHQTIQETKKFIGLTNQLKHHTIIALDL
ncbi:tyrosine-type recombinase/integrase [Staphylococcus saccharolyticus]|uniref:DNA integration/recombination/invertion protein n=1 Tax=Staphylococcus saccharolyticus TaxID=33028 RepID=A0A380HAD2_9STAP|nr:tyrosine-type recombinase/integrase [Staphylococcus saccharolyticus]MBL7565831.1 tyrosine-type recombinase/integrase [Staphylococcus saccharolyticus]MBL7572087.1 tyrosine-type recombinase/integrase [Staphylococcus saccharolyticus]QQB97653.1 tyrosine-type recombinase/integrase [Staphylococcus saccharolyticus]QRJ66495.1 tyrosine-type recombinase/integrase [Staphylococcus saccharolyticus]RTX94779.1 integrase [Staphylococcus saccharolyticus]